MPAPTYFTALAAFTATRPISARICGVTMALGVSSMTFWCRRCTLHSRSPSQMQLPCVSAKTWISTCRGRAMAFSMYTRSSAKEAIASRLAVARAESNSRGSATSRIPLPPPPAAALSMIG